MDVHALLYFSLKRNRYERKRKRERERERERMKENRETPRAFHVFIVLFDKKQNVVERAN